ncbi:uncharacterized protein BXZ73DRAFT_91313 [Epithele typhae]|uniref:uncharacterized protein n=1 Tax=Epithele typhae TaxID=378194 RepID=UPI002008612D|nr:uncharacterized protein BXZ73DRAFT_91313 [Epithele typhae]KAH9924325.1 hypothetical protein BXZ73DRAFT_91313 [Epithele typhae]
MSSPSTPVPTSGYASPAPSSSTTPAPPSKPNAPPKPKPVNVFSNDGSFLERFQRLKKEEDEKKKQEDVITKCVSNPCCVAMDLICSRHRRKREFDSRFKNRGKRRSPDTSSPAPATESPTPAKKAKVEEPLSAPFSSATVYQKELQNYADRSLKDSGIGVRPLVK